MAKLSYTRTIPALQGAYVPRLILPMKFEAETVYVLSQVDVPPSSLAALVSKHYMKDGKIFYCHRIMHLPPKRRKA